MAKSLKIGIIGCGFIGKKIIENFKNDILWVYDIDYKKCILVKKEKKSKFKCLKTLNELEVKKVDLIVECASQEAVKEFAELILKNSNLMIASVGALSDEKFLKNLRNVAKKNNKKIFIPNGAIGAIDALQSLGTLEKVKITTIKNPKSLGMNNQERQTIFNGNAKKACKKFPKNINVSATLSIFGIGFDKTEVEIMSDPNATKTKHVIEAESKNSLAKFKFEIESIPAEENPKTSITAANSIVKAIQNLKNELICV